MFPTIIEFCVSNLASGTQEVRAILEKDMNLDIVEYSCLGKCGPCERGMFALVNGEVVIGENAHDLLEKIYLFLEKDDYSF